MLNAARRLLRRALPMPVRQAVALLRRGLTARGQTYAKRALAEPDESWPPICTVEQPIKQSQYWEGKLHNLKIATAMVDGLNIAPGEVFSVWALIGRPTAKRGFAVGRAIRADEETGDVGGGLCQLSGLIYELGLRAGLEVIERHPHSRDLYSSEDERFTPLGLDATVVWPWKDLRLRNGLGVPLQLRCSVNRLTLHGELTAPAALPGSELTIERIDHSGGKHVSVWRGIQWVSHDRYR